MQPIKNILELRRHLAGRFPQLRSGSEQFRNAPAANVLPRQNLSAEWHDAFLAGRLPKGEITELVLNNPSCGSALMITTWICRLGGHHWISLIDGSDSFDPASLGNAAVPRFLWVRCQNTDQALKAADLVLRDGNSTAVLLDLALNPSRQLRKIPPTTWYRLQRIVEHTTAALLVIMPCHLISCADSKWSLSRSLSLEALGQPQSQLLDEVALEIERKPLLAREAEGALAEAG